MTRQGCRVQLEQSNMCRASNMAKMYKGGFLQVTIEKTQYLIHIPHTKVQEETKWGVQFPGPRKLKAAIDGQHAMVNETQTDGCLACHNITGKNLQIHWRQKGMGAPPLQPPLPLPGTLSSPPSINEAAQASKLENLTPSVSNSSGPSLRVRVRVKTGPLPNWQSRLSINLYLQHGYGSMVNTQMVWLRRVVSGSPRGSIHRFIYDSSFWSFKIVSYQNRIFNNQLYVVACFAACNINWFGIGVVPLIYCIIPYQWDL